MLPELEIIEALCRGVDPRTGEIVGTPRDPKVDQIRLRLLDALRRLDRQRAKDKPINSGGQYGEFADLVFLNRGKAWLMDDDEQLSTRWKCGATLDEMEKEFGRTAGALAARLAKLKIVADREVARQINIQRGGQYGLNIVPLGS